MNEELHTWSIMLNFDCKEYKNYDSETLKLCLVSKKNWGKIQEKKTKEKKWQKCKSEGKKIHI